MKILSICVLAALLAACASPSSPPDTTARGTSNASPRSGVEFYGTIDAGIGSQRISR
ncbi:hypothetical protein LSG25_00535 [Paralcaligenes sp. KSB-10]|uniref:hypothetical protein n=1 Tax=Paralcaligenes sp. KSB-10 TaxID=2901142 RepID=UPI001E2DABAF|nr:hypothetical protein [Paralcaligenes sp. KSB-10]UHL64442.1 hypothetical protein LSG25_00535 [Paralcaligenes sp. KSB-10]